MSGPKPIWPRWHTRGVLSCPAGILPAGNRKSSLVNGGSWRKLTAWHKSQIEHSRRIALRCFVPCVPVVCHLAFSENASALLHGHDAVTLRQRIHCEGVGVARCGLFRQACHIEKPLLQAGRRKVVRWLTDIRSYDFATGVGEMAMLPLSSEWLAPHVR